MDGRNCVHDGDCRNISPSEQTTQLTNEDFMKKKTFKDKFIVAWNFMINYTHGKQFLFEKNAGDSIRWRTVGNQIYTSTIAKITNDYLSKSIEAYTKSIAYAPLGSNELSLAYANRSAVLFKARLYEDCLLDIERSLKIGYPDKLKTKLFLRQSLCFKALKPASGLEPCISMANAMQWLPNLKKINPKYDIIKEYPKLMNELDEPRDKNVIMFLPKITNKHPQIIGAADSIELKTFKNNQQYMIASRDIKAGEFIYVDKPFEMIVSIEKRHVYCWHCCLETVAGVPCDKCPQIIYCSNKCKDAAWHEYHDIECPFLNVVVNSPYKTEHLVALRALIKSLKATAGGLVELKEKINKIDSMKDKRMIMTNGKLDFNTIDNFLRLDFWKPTSEFCTYTYGSLAVMTVAIFGFQTNVLGKNNTVKEIYANDKAIILGELVMRYLMAAQYNCSFFSGKIPTILEPGSLGVVQPIHNLFKHSCDANVGGISYAAGTILGYLVEKPIKKGKLITDNSGMRYEEFPKSMRLDGVKRSPDGIKLPCDCRACVENLPMLLSLPSYQSLDLPRTIKLELSLLEVMAHQWDDVFNKKDRKKMLEIKDSWSQMTNTFHQHISVPCRETSEFSMYLALIYRQIGITPSILN
ncbi:SET and MYND domain-containing protein 4-like [Aphidius gifuensis]|uniref:SET and MYND domain-containing protein 4-like n=1 Tax=Aphidius gifuensis TaxID=684658 RepID=UPI001CDCF083|nr:SET and MYND domain-containing protein 4-like [Aphidius gifuensis]